MTHEIIDQNGDTVADEGIINEVKYMIEKDLEYTYFDGRRIDFVWDKNFPKERVTKVKVEF